MRFITSLFFLVLALRSSRTTAAYRLESEGAILYVSEEDLRWTETVFEAFREGAEEIRSRLGIDPPSNVVVVMGETEEAFRRFTAGRLPDWVIGASSPRAGVIYLKSPRIARYGPPLRETVIHELVHVCVGRLTHEEALPRWFDEGVAQRISRKNGGRLPFRLARAFAMGRAPGLEEIETVFRFRMEQANLLYEAAASAVAYLVRKGGEGALAQILERLSKGESFETAFQTTLGQSTIAFESEWKTHFGRQYRWAVLADETVLFGTVILVLFGLAWWQTRNRTRAIQRQWEGTHEDLPSF